MAWIKLKKEFATLDVVVTGVEYGHGRRREVLSDYTFAVRDEESGSLLTVGKAYSGLTDDEIAGLAEGGAVLACTHPDYLEEISLSAANMGEFLADLRS